MRVAFNVRMLGVPILRGIGRYAVNLLTHLPNCGITPILCSPWPIHANHRQYFPADRFEVVEGGSRSPLVWDQTWDRLAAKAGAKVLHALSNYGLPLFPRRPAVLTLHDAIDYAFYKDRTLGWGDHWSRRELIGRWMHWSARRGADRVITVSEYSKRDIARRLSVPASRIDVVYEAADPSFHPADESAIHDVRRRYELNGPYYFYYGGWERRKNVDFLLRAFADAIANESQAEKFNSGAMLTALREHVCEFESSSCLPKAVSMAPESTDYRKLTDSNNINSNIRLVLAGGASGDEHGLRELAVSLGIGDRVVWLGYLSDVDLRILLSDALAFVYPSRAEGFGLQLCEAMACGCPVLAADATCLPEILGDGGATFSLRSPAALSSLLERVAADEPYRRKLKAKSTARGLAFSWDRCAERTADVYRELLHE